MESVLLWILGILVMIVGFAVSVGLHEVGHLVPAKLFKVKVTQFMVGFGRTIWSRRKGETEYGVKAIPLGGYVAMIGMYPPVKGRVGATSTGFFQTLMQDARDMSKEQIAGDDDRAFYRLAVWKKIIVMAGGPAMNVLLGILFYAILFVGIGMPASTTTVASVSQCVVPADETRTDCIASDPAAPAVAAGIEPGDVIVAYDGTEITSWDQLSALIRATPAEATPITVERDGTRVDLTITPLVTPRPTFADDGTAIVDSSGQYVLQDVGFLGISSLQERQAQSFGDALSATGQNIAQVTGIIVNLPERLYQVGVAAFGGGERDANGPVSVVGVGRLAGEITADTSLSFTDRAATLIGILAALNIGLAIFNLIPLLPLDGGHILVALWEGIRKSWAKLRRKPEPKPIDTAKLIPVTFTVVILFGGMSLLLFYADIVNPISLSG